MIYEEDDPQQYPLQRNRARRVGANAVYLGVCELLCSVIDASVQNLKTHKGRKPIDVGPRN